MVSLQSGNQDDGNLKGESTGKEREESCLKHRNQPVILHCTVCKDNICIQCKLTSHEGHATEDLTDTGAKVKAKLQSLLERMTQERAVLEGVLTAVEDRRGKLLSLRETSEQGIRERADKVHRWVDECRDKVLETLQSLNKDMMDRLSATQEHLQHKVAALSAQSDHVTRVLRDDKAADIVALEGELKDLTMDKAEVSQMLEELSNEWEPYRCEHDPVAVSTAHLNAHIGVLKRSVPKNTPGGLSPRAQAPNTATVLASPSGPIAMSAASDTSKRSVTVSEVVYSRNPKSQTVAMCTTSEKRVWIKYKPSGEGALMGLFSKEGLLRKEGDVLPGDSIVTVLDDVTIGSGERDKCSWVRTDGRKGTITTQFNFVRFSKCGKENIVANVLPTGMVFSQLWDFSLQSGTTQIIRGHTKIGDWNNGDIFDVSACGKYFALFGWNLNSPTLRLFLRRESAEFQFNSSYSPGDKKKPLDACFFPVDGQEMLVVMVEGQNKLHVVDHTDGCRFVRYLDTGPVKLDRPFCLATDHDKVLCVGCKEGKAVLLEF